MTTREVQRPSPGKRVVITRTRFVREPQKKIIVRKKSKSKSATTSQTLAPPPSQQTPSIQPSKRVPIQQISDKPVGILESTLQKLTPTSSAAQPSGRVQTARLEQPTFRERLGEVRGSVEDKARDIIIPVATAIRKRVRTTLPKPPEKLTTKLEIVTTPGAPTQREILTTTTPKGEVIGQVETERVTKPESFVFAPSPKQEQLGKLTPPSSTSQLLTGIITSGAAKQFVPVGTVKSVKTIVERPPTPQEERLEALAKREESFQQFKQKVGLVPETESSTILVQTALDPLGILPSTRKARVTLAKQTGSFPVDIAAGPTIIGGRLAASAESGLNVRLEQAERFLRTTGREGVVPATKELMKEEGKLKLSVVTGDTSELSTQERLISTQAREFGEGVIKSFDPRTTTGLLNIALVGSVVLTKVQRGRIKPPTKPSAIVEAERMGVFPPKKSQTIKTTFFEDIKFAQIPGDELRLQVIGKAKTLVLQPGKQPISFESGFTIPLKGKLPSTPGAPIKLIPPIGSTGLPVRGQIITVPSRGGAPIVTIAPEVGVLISPTTGRSMVFSRTGKVTRVTLVDPSTSVGGRTPSVTAEFFLTDVRGGPKSPVFAGVGKSRVTSLGPAQSIIGVGEVGQLGLSSTLIRSISGPGFKAARLTQLSTKLPLLETGLATIPGIQEFTGVGSSVISRDVAKKFGGGQELFQEFTQEFGLAPSEQIVIAPKRKTMSLKEPSFLEEGIELRSLRGRLDAQLPEIGAPIRPPKKPTTQFDSGGLQLETLQPPRPTKQIVQEAFPSGVGVGLVQEQVLRGLTTKPPRLTPGRTRAPPALIFDTGQVLDTKQKTGLRIIPITEQGLSFEPAQRQELIPAISPVFEGPIQKQSQKQIVGLDFAIRQQQKQQQLQLQKVGFTPFIPLVGQPFIPIIPGGLALAPQLDNRRGRDSFFKGAPQFKGFTPSATAAFFDIIGDPKRRKKLTGFEIRPIPKKFRGRGLL